MDILWIKLQIIVFVSRDGYTLDTDKNNCNCWQGWIQIKKLYLSAGMNILWIKIKIIVFVGRDGYTLDKDKNNCICWQGWIYSG